MRTLLVMPPGAAMSYETCNYDENKTLQDYGTTASYSLGLPYIKAYLESKGEDVDLLWCQFMTEVETLRAVEKYMRLARPQVVGIQIFTANRIAAFHIIEMITKYHPQTKIVIGGIHTSVCYESILKKYPDVVAVMGEGEETFYTMLQAFRWCAPYEVIDGIAFVNSDGEIVRTQNRKLLDLNALPFPDHAFFLTDLNRRAASIMSSRGCPNKPKCSFCSIAPGTEGHIRFRTPENVVSEIEYIHTHFPHITHISFLDDAFLSNNKRVVEICRLLKEKNLHYIFECQARIKPLSKEVVQAMDDAGFRYISFGMESSNPFILQKCHKNTTNEDVERAVELFRGTAINICTNIVTGLPGETRGTAIATAKFVRSLQRKRYYYYQFVLLAMAFPGTELYEDMKARGMITDDYWFEDKTVPVYTGEHTLEELERYKDIVRDYVDCDRALNTGFSKQWCMLPSIYLYKLRMFILPRIASRLGISYTPRW